MEKRDGLGHTTKATRFVSLGNNSKGKKNQSKNGQQFIFLLYNTILGKRGSRRRQKKWPVNLSYVLKSEILHNLIALT